MIVVLNRGSSYLVDNNDKERVVLTQTERRDIEELTGVDIGELDSKTVRIHVDFINVADLP